MFFRPARRYFCVAALVTAAAALTSRDNGSLHAQTSGPVAAYSFSEAGGTTAADASGNRNTATLHQGAWATGAYGVGLQFDGVDDDIQIPPASSLDLTSGFTFETWIKPAAPSDSYVWWRQQDSGQDAYVLELRPNGTVTVAINTSTAYYPLTTVPRIPLNNWTHLAVTYDGFRLKVYFNATEVARRTVAGTLVPSSQPMFLGEWFNGLLDETRLYRRALSGSEIAFDRGAPVDAAASFQVTVSTPSSNATGVLTTPVTATFSRAVNASTVTTSTFELRDSTGTPVPTIVSYSAATRTATLTPAIALSPSTDYTARVVGGSSGITDTASNTLAADVSWTFRAAAPAGAPSAALAFSEGTGTTTVDWTGNGNSALLVNNPAWTPGRFGNGVRLAGGYDEVQVPSGETLALSNAFTFETWIYPTQYVWGDLWKQFLVDGSQLYGLMTTGSGAIYFSQRVENTDYPLVTTSTLPLNAWTHLAVTYDGSSIRIYFNGTEVASRAASGSLTPTAQPMEIGQFTIGRLDEIRIYRTALDTAAINVDLSALVDPTPPFQVTGTTPNGGAIGVLTTPVTATFNRVADPATLTTSTFVLRDSGNTLVPAAVDYNASTRTATLTPANALAPLSDYTATVSGGSTGVTDTSGGPLANSVSWTFRTAAAASAPAAAYAFSEGGGTTSADASGNGNTAVFVGGPMWTSGQFGNGVSFAGGYDEVQLQAAGSLATAFTFEAWVYPTAYRGDLWKQLLPSSAQIFGFQIASTGALSFAGTFGGTDYPLASVSRIPLNAWSHVAVTYDGGYLRLFIDAAEVASRMASGSLASSPQPMEIGQWFPGKLDEVRVYRRALGAGEIALDRGAPIDRAAPFAVSSTTPANGALGVLNSPITATFGHAVQASTVTTATFQLRDFTNTLVPASVSYDAATRTATLVSSAALAPLGNYTARVVGGNGGVTDTSAHTLAADVTWTFRTAAAASSPSAAYSFVEGTGTATADGSGNGHTASLVHGPRWTSGKLGGGLSFAGSYDEVQAPTSRSLGLSNAFTFAAWVRPTAYAWGDLWSQRHSDGREVYGISTTNTGAVYVSPHFGDADYPLSTPTTLALNVWTHVAVTYDGVYLRVYFDGVEVASRAANGSMAETTQPIEMGQWFQGALDEVRIYRIGLDAAGIAADRARSVSCSYTTSARTVNVMSSGGSGSFEVAAPDGCGWTPESSVSWITVSRSGASVIYAVAPNDSPAPRAAVVTVADQVVTISQDAGQNYRAGSASSPDNEVTAVWYQLPTPGNDHWLTNCVQLARVNQRVDAGGACSFVGISRDDIRLQWTARRKLVIWYPPNTKVVKADTRWDDVTITYSADPKLLKH